VLLPGDLFPDLVHVRDVGLRAADDPRVWKYAQDILLTFCSKDSDMHQRNFVLGHPPKIISVRLGNCSTSDAENLLRRHLDAIEAFDADDYASFLALS
jgi:predicted nuclease of predicted toxin-antitoxin system